MLGEHLNHHAAKSFISTRLATEFAALAAQQAVSSAALTAQLGRSEEAQKQRLEHVESETLGGIGGC